MSQARRFLQANLERWAADAFADTATLLLSEVVTNVVLHAGTPLELVLRFSSGGLRVEVHDRHPAMPLEKRYGLGATTGRGMRMVEALSAEWGAERTPDGKYVWFVLDDSSVGDGAASAEIALFEVDVADLADLEALAQGSKGKDASGARHGPDRPASAARVLSSVR